MANRKISDLTEMTAPDSANDVFVIVDQSEGTSATGNKKITHANVLSQAPDGTAAAPAHAFQNATDTGLYLYADNELGVAAGGSHIMKATATGISVSTDGAEDPDCLLHVKGPGTAAMALLESTDNDAASAPDLVLWRNSSTPAVDDLLGTVLFTGNNSSGESHHYARIVARAATITDNSERGELILGACQGDVLPGTVYIHDDKVGINSSEPSTALHVHSDQTGNLVTFDCSQNGSGAGGNLRFLRRRGTSGAQDSDDIASIQFDGKSADGSVDFTYAEVQASIVDSDGSSADGKLTVSVIADGTSTTAVEFGPDRVDMSKPVKLAQGGTISAVSDSGTSGEMRWDANYLYLHNGTGWRRIALTSW